VQSLELCESSGRSNAVSTGFQKVFCMAIGWLTVLKSVPWAEVISNAPKVADGAKKLWSTIGKKSSAPQADAAREQPAQSPEDASVATLQKKLIALEADTADLHEQMLASSELIKALAEQNTQLIQNIEANRVRVLQLTAITAVLATIAVAGLILALVANAG
jgi:ribonuclease D